MGTDEREIVNSLDHGVAGSPDAIGRGFDGVLAVDTWRGWGAAFCMTVLADGDWVSDNYLFKRSDFGRWESMSSGGAHGRDWPVSWKPEIASESLLQPGQLAGNDVEETNGTTLRLVAKAGFATPSAHDVEVAFPGEVRRVPVVPLLNAFIILGPVGNWSMTALGYDYRPLAQPTHVDCQ